MQYQDEYYMNMNSYSTTVDHDKTTADELLGLLKLLSDPTRLEIMTVLDKKGTHSVSDCQCHVPDVSQSLLSHHIADLRKAGLIEAEKQGLRVYYSLTSRGHDVMAALTTLQEEYPMNGCTCQNCTCTNCSC